MEKREGSEKKLGDVEEFGPLPNWPATLTKLMFFFLRQMLLPFP